MKQHSLVAEAQRQLAIRDLAQLYFNAAIERGILILAIEADQCLKALDANDYDLAREYAEEILGSVERGLFDPEESDNDDDLEEVEA